MSLDEISRLELEAQELESKLQAIKLKKESLQKAEEQRIKLEKREAENKLPLIIKVDKIEGANLRILTRYRDDVIKLIRATPGHVYQSYVYGTNVGKNLIPLIQWKELKAKFSQLDNCSIEYEQGLEKLIEYETNTPPWTIDIADNLKHFTFFIGPRQKNYLLNGISGLKWDEDYTHQSGLIPLSEGWRIPLCLANVDGVIYTPAAQLIIFEQVERRAKIDKLAKQLDSDDPRLDVLTRQVFARGKWDTFRNQMEGFQRVGVTFALECNGRFLISDSTGLGKTWQILGYTEIMRHHDPSFMSVISVKASNIPNWVREIKRLTGLDPVICKNLNQASIVGKILSEKPNYIIIAHETMGTYEYLNTPENMAREEEDRELVYMWSELFGFLKPQFFGIDESHQIKNPSTHRSKAARRMVDTPHIIAATASPIKNRTSDFWPSLFLVDPVSFQSRDRFISDYTVDGRYPRNTEKLQELLRPVFLRRTKEEVQKYLPPINRIQRITELDDKHKKAYEDVMAGLWTQLESYDPKGQGGMTQEVTGILATITRLKQVCSSYKAIEYTPDLAQSLIDESEKPSSKVLIFSQFKGTAYEIARRLGNEAICTVRKVGEGDDEDIKFQSLNAEERDSVFESARNNPDIRFIVTTSASKEGHNLEFCDWVIFNDQFWTPEDHIQSEGRAYGRLANPHPIDSFYVIADVEIETWMQELLEQKMDIISQAIDGIETSRDSSGSLAMELIKKLKESMGWRR